MSGHGESLSSVIPYQQHITRKNKRKKTTDILITEEESIQWPDNPSKGAKEDSITDVEKLVQKKHLYCLEIR